MSDADESVRRRGERAHTGPNPGRSIEMQYLVSVIHDAATLATPTEAAAIDVFNERLQAEGHWVFAVGLGAPDTATVIDNRAGEPVFTDGPFLESKEYVA